MDRSHPENSNIQEEESIKMMTPEEDPVKEDQGPLPLHHRIRVTCKTIITGMTIEPILFFFMFSHACRMVTFQDLMITRSCDQFLNATHDACMDLKSNKELSIQAQKYGNSYIMMSTLFATLPSAFFAALLGPWSDKYGRRFPLLLGLTGSLIDGIISVILVAIEGVPIIFFPLCNLFSGLSGGMLMILTSCYSYLSDVTNNKNRAVRYGFAEFAFAISFPLGRLVGGQVSKSGYVSVFIIPPCCIVVCLVWVLFFLKETRPKPEDFNKKTMFKDLMSTKNLKECIKTCCKQRPGNLRTQLWLLIISICLSILSFLGDVSIGYQYALTMFGWDNTVYSNIAAIFSVLSSFLIVLFIPLMTKVLKVQDGVLGLAGCLSIMAENILKSVANAPWIYYYAKVAGSLHSSVNIAVRTRIPKIADPSEIGKMFSLLGVCESLVPIMGATLANSIYTNSVDYFPGLIFAIMSGIVLVPTSIFIWILQQPEPSIMKDLDEETPKVALKDFQNQTAKPQVKELKEIAQEVKSA